MSDELPKPKRSRLRWILLAVIVASIGWWAFTLPSPRRVIVIATGQPSGQYHQFGLAFREALLHQAGRTVEVRETAGSVENRELLLSGEADIALLQAGAVSLNEIAVVAPLHRDVVFVIARSDRGIESIRDLEGREVILGPQRSGMRSSAVHVLSHYGLLERVVDRSDLSFADILDEKHSAVDACIATTGLDNAQVRQLLDSEQFRLLPINARAIAAQRSFFDEFEIPAGFFSEYPAIPAAPIATVSTTALLAVRDDAPSELVHGALDALYKEDFQSRFPYLISHAEAAGLTPVRLHPEARRYFDPFDQVGWTASVLESLAATKELLVAIGAGVFLLWDRRRRQREAARHRAMQAQKDRLDAFLERTFDLERRLLDTADPDALQALLNDVTLIKLSALQELTHEDLRADSSFTIFLMQCANVISRIQMKIFTELQRPAADSILGESPLQD